MEVIRKIRTGKRGRPKEIYRGADGREYEWKMISSTRRRRLSWKQRYPDSGLVVPPRRNYSIWRTADSGKSYCLARLWVSSNCDSCGEVRTVRTELRMFYRRYGQNWIRSRRVTLHQRAPVSPDAAAAVFSLPQTFKRSLTMPEVSYLNRKPEIACKCRRYKLPSPESLAGTLAVVSSK